MVINYLTSFFPVLLLTAFNTHIMVMMNTHIRVLPVTLIRVLGHTLVWVSSNCLYMVYHSLAVFVIQSVLYRCCGLAFPCHVCYSFYFDNSRFGALSI
jgi:hypothetical protein